jgi:RNA polymerase III subunit Rpc25.
MSQQYSIEKSLEVIISDKKAKVWVWQYKEDQELVYEIGEKIRFKVMSSHYQKGGNIRFIMNITLLGFEVDEKPYCILVN